MSTISSYSYRRPPLRRSSSNLGLHTHLTRSMAEVSLPGPSRSLLPSPSPSRKTHPGVQASPTKLLLPALLSFATISLIYDLYTSRRRFSPQPVVHHALIMRYPGRRTDDPKNRVFCVRADRNILASGEWGMCFFDAEIISGGGLGSPRRVGRVNIGDAKEGGKEVRKVLRMMMEMKREVDKVYGVDSPLPWGTEGRPARRVMREWVAAVGKVLSEEEHAREMQKKRREKEKSGKDVKGAMEKVGEEVGEKVEGDEDEEKGGGVEKDDKAWIEVWDVRIRNRCEGWVVEPWHEQWGGLEDDDEMPFTWANSSGKAAKNEVKIADRWPGSRGMCFKV